MRLRAALVVALAALWLAPAQVLAHGPTIRLSYKRVTPQKLAVRVGDTVHFHNTSTTARTFTLRAEDGSFESPPLPRGEGWHYTFEKAGAFVFKVIEFPDMRGAITVVAD